MSERRAWMPSTSISRTFSRKSRSRVSVLTCSAAAHSIAPSTCTQSFVPKAVSAYPQCRACLCCNRRAAMLWFGLASSDC